MAARRLPRRARRGQRARELQLRGLLAERERSPLVRLRRLRIRTTTVMRMVTLMDTLMDTLMVRGLDGRLVQQLVVLARPVPSRA